MNCVIVTGAARGIGSVISSRLAEEGYLVLAVDIDPVDGAQARNVIPFRGDVSDETSVRAAVERARELAREQNGRVVGVVNNAATTAPGDPERLPRERWDEVLAVNLTGPFLMSRLAAPALRAGAQGQGFSAAIVNIASSRALMSEPGTEAYSASKGGVLALTHALAMSLAPEIRVNAISPGWIDVSALRPGGTSQQLTREDHEQHPVGRVGLPQDVAAMVVFLIGSGATFMTGQNTVLDGGMTRKMIYHE